MKYEQRAKQARGKDNYGNARTPKRLSEITRRAARLAGKGKWSQIDWNEYHRLNGELAGYKGKGHRSK